MSVQEKIFNIQKFSTHDGPGIRTVIFLTGCPLRCEWCSNPESQNVKSSIFWNEAKCIGCMLCKRACPHEIMPGKQGIDKACILCGECVRHCPAQALELMGVETDIETIMKEVRKDKAFFENSGGGVTISGGEPLMHPEFVIELAKAIKKEGFHLTLETTGYAQWDTVKRVFKEFDLVLYDIKQMNDEKHQKYTKVSNKLILENAKKARKENLPLIYRVPFIGGVNADKENTEQLAKFAKETNVNQIHLLPYHELGKNKYKYLRKDYVCNAYKPSKQEIEETKTYLEDQGFIVKIGG